MQAICLGPFRCAGGRSVARGYQRWQQSPSLALAPGRWSSGASDHPRYDPAALREFVGAAFSRLGLPQDDAKLVARCLVEADLRGQAGHGVQRLTVYAQRLRAGVVKAQPNIRVEKTAHSAVNVDGDDGMGFVVATRATEEAIALAKSQGVGLAGVKKSTHFGCSSHYVMQALEADMISLVFTNSSPALPVWGGARQLLGASPFAAGVPAGAEHPLVLDMSTTVIARGKLRLMSQRGELIPEGVGLDKNGKPTRDGMEAFHGVTLPFGGAKGAAISLLMDVFSGVLTGAAFGGKVRSLYNDTDGPQNVGHFILCVRPDVFMSLDEFKSRMDEMVQIIKAQPRADGFDEILMPGEPESKAMAKNERLGVPLQADVVEKLKAEGAQLGDLSFPEPWA
eukprot:TRINITY_DN75589_c0_g1_i1.p1 TRINITY_DN75589_c0_g1~~TRINITY_DN75589_c0_g1_i1.p1  ORF type:complete len:395 (-),score=75.45 TRINITY_DN75589_c0_g1_i1:511-1695(-)